MKEAKKIFGKSSRRGKMNEKQFSKTIASLEVSEKSGPDDIGVNNIRFVNKIEGEIVEIFNIDKNGKAVSWKDLEYDSGFGYSTYEGHPWFAVI